MNLWKEDEEGAEYFNYYYILGIDEEVDFKIEKTVDFYLEKQKFSIFDPYSVKAAYSVLSHPELKNIYDSFIKKGSAADFCIFIGDQFLNYYEHCEELQCYEENFLDEKLPEKVLKIAQELEKIEERFSKKTEEVIKTFQRCFHNETASTLELLITTSENGVWKESYTLPVREAFIRLFLLAQRRSRLIFSSLSVTGMLDGFTKLRVFINQCFSSRGKNSLDLFCDELSKEAVKKKITVQDEIVTFQLISEKFMTIFPSNSKDLEKEKLMRIISSNSIDLETIEKIERLLLSKEFDGLSFGDLTLGKGWEQGCNFLKAFSKQLEEENLSQTTEVIGREISSFEDRESFFRKKWIALPIFLVLFSIPVWLFFKLFY